MAGDSGRKNKDAKVKIKMTMTKEEFAEVIEEAFYETMTRIENKKLDNEKAEIIDQKGEQSKEQVKEKRLKEHLQGFLLVLQICFIPQHISPKLIRQDANIKMELLKALNQIILSLIGWILRGISILLLVWILLQIYNGNLWIGQFVVALIIAFVGLLYGGFFCASAKEVKEIDNESEIYNFSSGIMGAFAVILAVIALLL